MHYLVFGDLAGCSSRSAGDRICSMEVGYFWLLLPGLIGCGSLQRETMCS